MRPDEAGVVIRLMMVCNDLTIANAYLRELREGQTRVADHVRWGAGVYFLRMQIGHLSEAMSVIGALRKSPPLLRLVHQCTERGRDAFRELEACLMGQANFKQFESQMMRVRNKTAFHYDDKLVRKALMDRAKTAIKPQSVTASNDVQQVRFGVADAILDTLTVRHIWKIGELDLNEKLDEILDFGFRLFVAVMDFGQEFIMRYVEENAAY